MSEITAASREQTSGIEQINRAVTQMDDATQRNAALVEEAAAASQSLQEQSVKLTALVGVFKIDERMVSNGGPVMVQQLSPIAAPREAVQKLHVASSTLRLRS
jgi:hypothetical protein